MKHHHQSETAFLKRKYPLVKAVLDYVIKRLELFVLAGIVDGIGGCNHWHIAKHEQQIQQLENEPKG